MLKDEKEEVARIMSGKKPAEKVETTWKPLSALTPAEAELYDRLMEIDKAAARASKAASEAGHTQLAENLRGWSAGAYRLGVEIRIVQVAPKPPE